MKILVIGLDCAAPEVLLEDERLTNIRHLMSVGCYGRLESVVPPITVPAWMCMATSQDPGSLGVYGFRNRVDRSYGGLRVVDSKAFRQLTIWDQIARQGGRANIVGVPPNYPPRRINGVSIGCFLTPSEAGTVFVEPQSMQSELIARFGDYVVDVTGYRTADKLRLRDQIYAMTRTHFEVIRYLMTQTEWDYFQFVEIGLDRMHHGFWKHHDPSHVLHPADSPFADIVRDYYQYLDDEIGRVLQCLTEETIICVLSDHGAQRLDGGFCINQWLIDQGWLVLRQQPDKITPFAELDVDWKRTRVWSEGGYCARVFLNLQGREPEGAISPGEYERFRDEVKARLEATTDANGKPLGTLVFKPEEIYRQVRGIAPDLLVHFGGLFWRSVGGVGYPSWHVLENDTGPDDCNHAQFGAFVLAATNLPIQGRLEQAHLLVLLFDLLSRDASVFWHSSLWAASSR
ncbi:MAG: alkaline phosphatase family protein, partial [Pirellulales bacterium]|nr:alkaline phosphatase family protein [Pirellulales bacterium]